MAVPTLVALSFASGLTGGRYLIDLTGTNFRLPPPPPAVGRVPKPGPSMRAIFGGTTADETFVLSPTRALVIVPSHDPGTVDVAVQNLDVAGVPIGGESATLAQSFSFVRPDLTAESILARVGRALLRRMKREVIENVVITVHTEYDEKTGDALSIIDDATLPVIVLSGPNVPTNRFYSQNVPRVVQREDGSADLLRPAVTGDASFTLVAGSESMVELQNLLSLVAQFFQRNPMLYVQRDADDVAKGLVGYEMQATFDGLVTGNRPNDSNIRQFSGEFVIRGIDLDEPNMVVARVFPTADYVPDYTTEDVVRALPGGGSVTLKAPIYSPEEASRRKPWALILGSSQSGPVTPTSTPDDGVGIEQFNPAGDES